MNTKILLLVIFISSFYSPTFAQDIENWIANNEKVPVQKIYLHTDSEIYFQNDTLWYKVYLTDSRTSMLIPGAQNIFINLVDKTGKTAVESIALCVNGQVSGSFAIPAFTQPGNYLLQAFTDYLLNFTDDARFQKTIEITRLSNMTTRISTGASRIIADAEFFPEGGNLLEDVTNLVAFKAIDRAGKGVEASGIVRDEKGNTITTFKTNYKGMGMFFLTPKLGKKYTAKINGFPGFNHPFTAQNKNLKIQLVNHTSNEVILNIASNSEAFSGKGFYLVNMYRGEVLFYQPFVLNGLNQVLKFDSKILKDGINRMVLLDPNLKPVSERLLFQRPKNVNPLFVAAQNEIYKTRSPINISISNQRDAAFTEISNLSVSVAYKSHDSDNHPRNILSHLLIDSEINGFYEPSLPFFTDDEISSEAKFRLLMLTSGWSRYFWNQVPTSSSEIEIKKTAGLEISGTATNILTKKPIENGEITLVLQKEKEAAFLSQTTNKKGEFKFSGLLFNDTATIHVQAKNDNGRLNTELAVSSAFKTNEVSQKALNSLQTSQQASSELAALKLKNNPAGKKSVKRKRQRKNISGAKSNHQNLKLYSEADFVLELEENGQSFENVLDFMVGKVPGVDISGDEVRVRGTSSFGASSSPLFLIDGVPLVPNINFELPKQVSQDQKDEDGSIKNTGVIQSIRAIPINDVEKIEVLKSPQNLAAFGTLGANGVIAIYTKLGHQSDAKKLAKGFIEKQIVGYASQRKFYLPKYTPQSGAHKSDYRTTLFFDGDVKTHNGIADVNFFSGDATGRFEVIIEGISESGKICVGQTSFEISE